MRPIGSQSISGYLHELKVRLAELEKFAAEHRDLPVVCVSTEFLYVQVPSTHRELLIEKFGHDWRKEGSQYSKKVGEVTVQFHMQNAPESAEVRI